METENVTYLNRAEKIIDILREKGTVNVGYLAELFHVSGTTIRTDLNRLEENGEIVRTHGGAMLRSSYIRESRIAEREHEEEKNRIAQAAVQFVHNSDTILIDTGTTMAAFARALTRSSLKELRIFTIDLEIAAVLENNPSFEIRMVGGRVRNGFHYCYGHQVIEEIGKYNFEKLFLATSAMESSHGLTTSNVDLAELKEAMIRASGTIYLLSDSSKAGQVDFQRFANLRDIDVCITDHNIPADILETFREQMGTVIAI
ncbi:MAG: DeoR/GlpR transcriptional regulator [Blautia sp.]|nr:DeoR/GlpR transcriptional regulator [Blautia sp.]